MLKQIKYFQSVVRLNSFSEAAVENFISQSATSQQIQALERELGFKLLEKKIARTVRRVPQVLTLKAALYLPSVIQTLLQIIANERNPFGGLPRRDKDSRFLQ